jgi:hypothetical protein
LLIHGNGTTVVLEKITLEIDTYPQSLFWEQELDWGYEKVYNTIVP